MSTTPSTIPKDPNLQQNTHHVLQTADESRQMHERFMREAVAMATLALSTNETPVGCVFVRNGSIISRGMNATNRCQNGTRHAEFMALSSLTSQMSPNNSSSTLPASSSKTLDPSFWQQVDLYVTIEPCIMCASMLRQIGIRKVYFGAVNDRFGGTGGVFSVHETGGDGLQGYEVSGGWLRDEAVDLLRRFYDGVNEKAPEPRIKKERAGTKELNFMEEGWNEGG